MFDFLLSEQGKMRRHAANWLEVADRVYKFRRDELTEVQNQQLLAKSGELRLRLKEKADASRLKLAIESLEDVLRDTGGRIYPTSSLVENVEFFLVAAIVILGIRAYFVQPFKIPTNSMWPSYYGVTHESDAPGEPAGALRQAWRFLTLGGWHYRVDAPADGELLLPVFADGTVAFTQVPGRTAFVFPTTKREYFFRVGGEAARIVIPGSGATTEDFRMEKALHDMLEQHGVLGNVQQTVGNLSSRRRSPGVTDSVLTFTFGGQRAERRVYWIPTGRTVKRGEPIMSFDLLTGDLLFVDRITYNFVRPKVGQGFVFHTRQIPDIGEDQYYIKRLVGVPGDTLEIKEPVLWRNGTPIDGADAFDLNGRRSGKYRGYFNAPPAGRDSRHYLFSGEVITVPTDSFFALGDNSAESRDSRYWGFVPAKEVVGKPLFIYYPLTKRWGLAN